MKQRKVELSLLCWGRWCHASGDPWERVACVFTDPMRMASVTRDGESEAREEAVLESPEWLPWSFQCSGWFQNIGDGQIFYWFVEIKAERESVWWWESLEVKLCALLIQAGEAHRGRGRQGAAQSSIHNCLSRWVFLIPVLQTWKPRLQGKRCGRYHQCSTQCPQSPSTHPREFQYELMASCISL